MSVVKVFLVLATPQAHMQRFGDPRTSFRELGWLFAMHCWIPNMGMLFLSIRSDASLRHFALPAGAVDLASPLQVRANLP